MVKSTKALLFLGTPHSGSDHAPYAVAMAHFVSLASVKLKKPNKRVLRVLEKDSETLADISETFSSIMTHWTEKVGGSAPKVYCFSEEKPVPGLGVSFLAAFYLLLANENIGHRATEFG